MSTFNFKSTIKKLLPSKKEWKSFTTTLQSKLPKPIKKLASRLKRSVKLTKRSSNRHHYHLLQKGFPAIYIDELYVPESSKKAREPLVASSSSGITTPDCRRRPEKDVARKHELFVKERKKVCVDRQHQHGKSNKTRVDVNNGERMRLRRMQGSVDERAEDFITKFRENMKLQREQSMLDFQEMLARSV